jgi:hypothetical protein
MRENGTPRIEKKGGYSGGRPRSTLGPPPTTPSGSAPPPATSNGTPPERRTKSR